MSEKFDWSKYETADQTPQSHPSISSSQQEQDSSSFDWNKYPSVEEDSTLKSAARYAYQPISGALSKFTAPANIVQMIGQGESLDAYNELEERLPELQKMFPTAHWENFQGLDREKYMQALQTASDYFPTQQNLERGIENTTGLPLTAQNEAQNLLRMSGAAASFRPGGLTEKSIAGVVAPTVKAGLDVAGTPEILSETAGYIASGLVPSPTFSKVAKPSGFTSRRFETITKKTPVSSAVHDKITTSVEQEFKGISNELMDKSSLTYRAMQEDPKFKTKISGLFDKVSELSKDVKGTIYTNEIRAKLKDSMNSRPKTGISKDEFERSYLKELRKLHRQIPYGEEISASQLVEQYRKNNKALTELFEPGRSKAFNRAKAESLIDYNKTLSRVIEENYPKTEFSDLFNFTNKRWSEIKDIEAVNGFVNDLFDGKINYAKGNKFFERNRVADPFKRTLGEENFNKFSNLVDDLMTTEQAYSLLKKADSSGYKELAKDGLAFLVHPSLGKLAIGKDLWNLGKQKLLDKPQVMVKWKSGIENFKQGNYAKAQTKFREVKSDLSSS